MKVTYQDHAVDRMSERNISTTLVASIISSPDGKIRQSLDKWIYYKKIIYRRDNLVAAVVLEKSKDHFEVVTVLINFEVR